MHVRILSAKSFFRGSNTETLPCGAIACPGCCGSNVRVTTYDGADICMTEQPTFVSDSINLFEDGFSCPPPAHGPIGLQSQDGAATIPVEPSDLSIRIDIVSRLALSARMFVAKLITPSSEVVSLLLLRATSTFASHLGSLVQQDTSKP